MTPSWADYLADDEDGELTEREELQMAITDATGWEVPGDFGMEALRAGLRDWIEARLGRDMAAVIRVLYRVDVDEEKLKFLLKEKVNEDPAMVIADVLIDRQLAKMAYRRAQKEKPSPPDTDEDGQPLERWD